MSAVSLDFHNTIAVCDRWFELEVNLLIPSFLDWLAETSGQVFSDEIRHAGQRHYRAIRRQVMTSGTEQDAASCVQAVLARLGISISSAQVDDGLEAIMRPALCETYPVPGVIDIIHQVRRAEIPMVVVSSAAYHPFLEWTLELFDVSNCFHEVMSSASSGIYKSSPGIYKIAARRLDLPAGEIVHIGDSHRFDVLSANEAGLRTVWLANGNDPCESEVADLTVRSLDQVMPWLLAESGRER